MNEESTSSAYTTRAVSRWDNDSGMIGIDNRCSACTSHSSVDFLGELNKCKSIIHDFGGRNHYNVKVGTLEGHWKDDQGKLHKLIIPKSYDIPEGGVILSSPQYWAQTQKDIKNDLGTKETTKYMSCTL